MQEIWTFLMQQDQTVLAPAAAGAIFVLNQILKMVMAVVRIGIIATVAAALLHLMPPV